MVVFEEVWDKGCLLTAIACCREAGRERLLAGRLRPVSPAVDALELTSCRRVAIVLTLCWLDVTMGKKTVSRVGARAGLSGRTANAFRDNETREIKTSDRSGSVRAKRLIVKSEES